MVDLIRHRADATGRWAIVIRESRPVVLAASQGYVDIAVAKSLRTWQNVPIIAATGGEKSRPRRPDVSGPSLRVAAGLGPS